jgi:hypothetical protein
MLTFTVRAYLIVLVAWNFYSLNEKSAFPQNWQQTCGASRDGEPPLNPLKTFGRFAWSSKGKR